MSKKIVTTAEYYDWTQALLNMFWQNESKVKYHHIRTTKKGLHRSLITNNLFKKQEKQINKQQKQS